MIEFLRIATALALLAMAISSVVIAFAALRMSRRAEPRLQAPRPRPIQGVDSVESRGSNPTSEASKRST